MACSWVDFMAVKVVTDSLSDLPSQVVRDLDVTVVPLTVRFGSEEFMDGVDLDPDAFFDRLINGPVLPTTAVPSIGQFAEVYERLGEDADGIVSVHVSSKVSGTYNSAVQASSQAQTACSIEVVDSLQASMGLGLIAVEAASTATGGASLDEVVGAARDAVGRSEVICLMDTLEYLEKGGRIGKAQAMLGALLNIKPIIAVKDGEVHPVDRPRTRAKGIARLKQIAREMAPVTSLCVMYSTADEAAHDLAQELSDLLPEAKSPMVARFGPGLGTYVGPDALGVGLLRGG